MVKVSVILPCKDEEQTIEKCIKQIQKALDSIDVTYEILVVDNNSMDRSGEIAKANGARVIEEKIPGYGVTLRKGFKESKGEFLFMGDSDGTYPFYEIPKMITHLEKGSDFVIGIRKPENGAMPILHKYIGNPGLSMMTRILFNTPVRDSHCGLRGIKKDKYHQLYLRGDGMEYATEMVVKAAMNKLKVTQFPIKYYAREDDNSKLSSFRDGYRHVRFMLKTFLDYKVLRRGYL